MELATMARMRPAAFGSAWLWVPVFGAGLAAVLAGHLPPGGAPDLARAAAHRMIAGDFALDPAALGALAFTAGWIVLQPLAVIGAILWLEFRFSPGAGGRNHLLAWAMQTISLALLLGALSACALFGLFPAPLIRVGEARGVAALLLVSVPAFLLSMLAVDFFGYWLHRAQHRLAFLWRFHRLHHSFEVDVLHSVSHPVDHLLYVPLVAFPTALLIGVSQEQLFLLVAFYSIQGQINHTRLPIHLGPLGGTLLCDNRYHFIHHSLDPAHRDKNFADRFPVLDMLFGTYAPRGEGLAATGLAREAPPASLGDYLLARLPGRADGAGAG
jgi:sterol desaturase/sphingolipid hydroxylase (fatty acid hydroxylase superfamily)